MHNYIKNTSGDIPTDIIVKFAKDIASGMNAIHSSGIVHRDLKSLVFFLSFFFYFENHYCSIFFLKNDHKNNK